jgi:membrane associated rhomboid family serine protease
MLVSYSAIHGGAVHFAFNALAFLLLGRALLSHMSKIEFGAAFVASVVAGAVFYLLLSDSNAPAVGMSGGVYGIGALWAAGVMRQRSRETGSLRPVIGVVGAAFAITVLAPFATGGQVAWQAHLGGAVLGLVWGCCRGLRGGGNSESHLTVIRK